MPLPELYAVRVQRNPYDTRYDQWVPNRYALGVEFPVRQQVILKPYYMRQNRSHSNPPYINGRAQNESVFFF